MLSSTQDQGMMNASLYVGDLHPYATDDILKAKFSEIGPVVSARVCCDYNTQNSLGYGYVNFEDSKDAEKALEEMNYCEILGRPVRIMWSQRDPSLRKSGKGNIFIKNLDKSIEQRELYDTFGSFGHILSCKIAMDESGKSKGYGFIHFEKEECAEEAIQTINKMMIRNRIVYVGKFIPKSERKSSPRKLRFNNIYVKNFPPDTDDAKLNDMFAPFGEIKSACVMVDKDGKSKGFGFVCYLDPDHAEAAVKALHGKEINGRALYATRAQRKEERHEELKQRIEKQKAERQSKYTSDVNLYVKNLDDTIDDEKLKETFGAFGVITSARVMRDANNRSKGFGFVCFSHPDQATKAVTDMNGSIVGSKPLYVALAQRKEDRRAKLLAEHQQRVAQHRNNMISAIAGHHAAHNFFTPTAFQQAPRYYQAGSSIKSQPRWNRPAGVTTGIPTQLSAIANRGPIPGHYLSGPNPNAALNPQLTAFTQFRSQGGVARPLGPSGIPAGPHMPTASVLNQSVAQQRQQLAGRQGVTMPPVFAVPANAMNQRASMASVVAGGSGLANVRQLAPQVPRSVIHPVMQNMTGATNVRFNQTARNVSAQPAPMASNGLSTILPSIGDQNPLTMSFFTNLLEDEKRSLGERLYPMVHEMYPDRSRKLTGMLLGAGKAEVIPLLESKESLRAKCEEAISVLKNSENAARDMADEGHTTSINAPGQNGDNAVGAGDVSSIAQGISAEAVKSEDVNK